MTGTALYPEASLLGFPTIVCETQKGKLFGLLGRKHFSNAHEAQSAIRSWIEHYNYKRTHQGIGGLVVPAERFHGQAEQVLEAIDQGIDITGENCFTSSGLERSIINIVLGPEGRMTLYLLGQPIILSGGAHVRSTQC